MAAMVDRLLVRSRAPAPAAADSLVEERKSKVLRKMILLTWDSRLEERLFALLGVDIFQQHNDDILLWDMQLAPELDIRFKDPGRQGKGAEKVRLLASCSFLLVPLRPLRCYLTSNWFWSFYLTTCSYDKVAQQGW
ncbi:hypothetical protein LX32DRAFT_1210 [Colletotrichum zoysiae]|uniref:Uncharacterized protein n=1 Tax=Colletotrichum zoysiae TaxID=1216348 RepID=A0AAD9HWN0_9PEZI|nr:hypothetical protein LX32DRAFT_1210 [Colletotrichum zoysiae]